jgi:hypothetical protein
MSRRLFSVIAIVACTGGYVLAANERANFILTDGERKSGAVVFHGGNRENLIAGNLNLDVGSGPELTIPIDQVAVIDFVGGKPQESELAQLPGSGHFLFLRDGTSQPGHFVNMIGGDTLIWENQAGQRQQYAIHDVKRVYLNPQSARTVFNYTGPTTNAVGTSGQASGSSIHVQANQAWTDTGLTVNQGDRVVFQASGQITWDQRAGLTATPDGNGTERRTGLPDPKSPVGALIGRIGTSAPFGIGTQTQPLVMPASGRLMLGVNDTELSDNSGFFTVVVRKQ